MATYYDIVNFVDELKDASSHPMKITLHDTILSALITGIFKARETVYYPVDSTIYLNMVIENNKLVVNVNTLSTDTDAPEPAGTCIIQNEPELVTVLWDLNVYSPEFKDLIKQIYGWIIGFWIDNPEYDI